MAKTVRCNAYDTIPTKRWWQLNLTAELIKLKKNLLLHLTSKEELDSKLEKALKLFISEELRKSLKACFYKRKKLSGKSLFEELNKVKAWRQVTGISGQFPV
jgi:TnpA family transposase